MKASWDERELECVYDHGWQIKDGMLVLTQKQFSEYFYHGYSDIKQARTLMIPSLYGVCLIFEGQHFIVQDE